MYNHLYLECSVVGMAGGGGGEIKSDPQEGSRRKCEHFSPGSLTVVKRHLKNIKTSFPLFHFE